MVGSPGFGDIPGTFSDYDNSEIVILPVPYDGTSTWLKGADKGPAAIIEASWNMYLYDIETDYEVYRSGINTDDPVIGNRSPDKMIHAVRDRILKHLNYNKFVVTIGGEHSVTIGAFSAFKEFFKKHDISVLQLDAHADLQEEYNGSRYNHACTMARIREMAPVVQAGIRSMDLCEKGRCEEGRVFYAREIHNNHEWMDNAIGKLTDTVYVTIDLDVFDISVMPATGTPEPGGLLWYDVLALLKKLAASRKIIGFDVMELCPGEYSKPYDFLVAKLIYKFLSYIFKYSRVK
jgi:agmatinase